MIERKKEWRNERMEEAMTGRMKEVMTLSFYLSYIRMKDRKKVSMN